MKKKISIAFSDFAAIVLVLHRLYHNIHSIVRLFSEHKHTYALVSSSVIIVGGWLQKIVSSQTWVFLDQTRFNSSEPKFRIVSNDPNRQSTLSEHKFLIFFQVIKTLPSFFEVFSPLTNIFLRHNHSRPSASSWIYTEFHFAI